jgi:uncharacterized protein
MQAKTERFEMRLDQETLDGVDEWRARQSGLPSRAEAIRRLIDGGLSSPSRPRVKLSDGEKLILLMLRDLYKHLKARGEIDPEFVSEAIAGGHYWGLRWRYSGILHDHEDSETVVSEVVDVLDMWSFLESSYGKLSQKDKAQIEAEAGPLGKSVRFPGFDGNNETEHLGIARFLIDDLERFSSFKGRDLNSHLQSIEAYRCMLRVFGPMRENLVGRGLSASEIIAILSERRPPARRKTAN